MDKDLIEMIDDIVENRDLFPASEMYSRTYAVADIFGDLSCDFYPHDTRDFGGDERTYRGNFDSDDFGSDFFSDNTKHYTNHCATVFSSHFGGNFGTVRSTHHGSQGS